MVVIIDRNKTVVPLKKKKNPLVSIPARIGVRMSDDEVSSEMLQEGVNVTYPWKESEGC